MTPGLHGLIGALIFEALAHRTRPRFVVTRVQIGTIVLKGDIRMVQLPVDKTAALGPLQIVDSFGNPAQVDGTPTWTLSDPNGVDLVAAADGGSAVLRSLDGALRTVQVQVNADADLGAGVETIQGVLDVEFIGGKAAAINIPFTVQ